MRISQYSEEEHPEINSLVEEIAKEFEEPIISSNPSTKKNFDNLWLVKKDELLIGTIGVIRLKNNNAILKSMFVKKEFRGKDIGVSRLLIQTAIDWLGDEKIERIFLGTMSQFKAAQKFYTKNGFFKIDKMELPSDFINNPLDNLYYRMDLIIDNN